MTPIILGGFNAAGITALTSTHSTSHSSPSNPLMFKNRLSAPQSTSLPSPALQAAVFILFSTPSFPCRDSSWAARHCPLEHSLPSCSKALFELRNPPAWQPESRVLVRKLKSGFFSLPQHLVCPDQPFQFSASQGEKELRLCWG